MADDLAVSVGSGPAQIHATETSAGSQKYNQHVLAGEKVRIYNGTPQSLTLTGSSQALTVPGGETHAVIYADFGADTDIARYWEGGAAPTNSTGKRLKDHEEIETATPSTFHAIISTGTTLILRIEYYHYGA